MHITIALTFGFIGLLAAIQSVEIQQPPTQTPKHATHYCVSYWPSDYYQDLTRQGDVSYDDIVCKKFHKMDIDHYKDEVPIERTRLVLHQIRVDYASKEKLSNIQIKYDQPEHRSNIGSTITNRAPKGKDLLNPLERKVNSLSRRATTNSGSSSYGLHFWNGDTSTHCMFTSEYLAAGGVYPYPLTIWGDSSVPAEGIQCFYLAHLPIYQIPKPSGAGRKRGTSSTGRTSDINSISGDPAVSL
ncbi:hypothetical protein FA10DRAFT_295251 [Acaromyces ingoldii]|uniref:Uncharacterized protein n=1 Tax=Acaromyces ingoldii TaxID=215250 RepID=A0A316YIW2_9BASI|nr:hypothetical protein FA10DRAFT_295251 [Acaromyces ingoldii]PWN89367.1 hypothetical protein FA10DRAFT_295251 [Acaromyces ingoldii]